jgi:hypothetical protein
VVGPTVEMARWAVVVVLPRLQIDGGGGASEGRRGNQRVIATSVCFPLLLLRVAACCSRRSCCPFSDLPHLCFPFAGLSMLQRRRTRE